MAGYKCGRGAVNRVSGGVEMEVFLKALAARIDAVQMDIGDVPEAYREEVVEMLAGEPED